MNHFERWQQTGGTLRVVELSPEHAVVDLCACTGEVMERWSTHDRELIEHVQQLVPDAGADSRTD